MMNKMQNGQAMDQLKTFAILLVVVGVTLTVGLKITSSVESEMNFDRDVVNETFNGTSDPFTYTVVEAGDSDFNQLTSATAYESESQTTSVTTEIVDAEAGKVNVSGFDATDGAFESLDYNYEDKDTQSRQGASDAIDGLTELSGFLPIIGLVIAAAVVISLVSRGFGSSGRRGRA